MLINNYRKYILIGNRYEKALSHYRSHITYRDSINNLEKVKAMAESRTEFEVSLKQSEVDILNQQKENQRNLILASFCHGHINWTNGFWTVSKKSLVQKNECHYSERKRQIRFFIA